MFVVENKFGYYGYLGNEYYCFIFVGLWNVIGNVCLDKYVGFVVDKSNY